MAHADAHRLVAWDREVRRMHARLREALAVTRAAVADGVRGPALEGDVLAFCHGFCLALDGHHRGEDGLLFPAVAAAHPELRPVLRSLEQDHSMIAHLLGELRAAVDRDAAPAEVDRHLEGVAAIMENHFRYEERALGEVLDVLDLRADPAEVLGPL